MTKSIPKEYKFVISAVVKPSKRLEYEKWLVGINEEVKNFSGFLGLDVIKPRTPKYLEYVIIMKFETHQDLINWQNSSQRASWLEKSRKFVQSESQDVKPSGLMLYITMPEDNKFSGPSYYKLVMMGIVTVFPLIILFDLIFGNLIAPLHDDLEIFLSVIFVSIFLTYPVMPWLTSLLDFWLYPKNDISA